MPNLAHITLIGHVGRDPEIRYTPGGDPIASFSLATAKKRGGEEITTWWKCTCFGKRATVLEQYLHKGDPLCVQGEAFLRPWQAKDGSQRQSLEVDVRDFQFLGGKSGGKSGGQTQEPAQDRNAASQQLQAPAADDFSDDIPFDRVRNEYCLY